MIELDGVEYRVQTPTENAYEAINYINDWCARNDVKNKKGEVIYIDTSPTNPLFIILFGFGYLISIVQRLIYSLGCAFSFNKASDKQLLNLAQIANVKRVKATKTTITCLVYADTEGPCTITQDLTCTVATSEGITEVFSPSFEVTIPAGEVSRVILVAADFGSFNVGANVITSFDSDVSNLLRMESMPAVPGQDEEPMSSLRKRLQERSSQGSSIDRAAEAITGLDGVSMCNIYFNYSNTESASVSGIEIPPRQSLLLVQGFSPDIAKTYFTYVTALTAGGDSDRSIQQDYISKAGQHIPLYFISPVFTSVYVRIFIEDVLTSDMITNIMNTVLSISANLSIGQGISTADIINKIHGAYPEVNIQDVRLSLDGEAYTYKITPAPDALLVFNRNNIEVV